LKPYDVDRVAALNEAMGDRLLSEADAAWRDWLRAHPSHKPSTSARWRSTLSAAINEGCRAHKVTPPELSPVRITEPDRVVYLTASERRRLLAAFNPYAACPVLLLAYQGLRTQEALRLDWRRVDLSRGTIHITGDETKTRRGRTLPMHPRVGMLLFGLWHSAGKPELGHVFVSQRGQPYADTRGRDGRHQGGNPLTTAHNHACKLAGVTGFRVHDWRHDWAARMVMAGVDLYTLMRLGGWSSLRMVERYASVTGEHMADAVRRLA
jgi:integrase